MTLDQIAEVDGDAVVDDEVLMRAARSCPYGAIVVTEAQSGKQVYPEVSG
jgi:ferredoxin